MRQLKHRKAVKRILDLSIAVPAVIILSPVMVLVAVAVGTTIGWPVLFRQTRPGEHGRPFELVKFRTMTNERDLAGSLLSDSERLPKFGQWLRSTSLDELPELWNVIVGEMSLVGPRPLLMDYLPLYSPWHARRHEVRPGMTGWAQVNGRNAAGWADRLEMDVWYVDNWTIALDMKILAATLSAVIRRHGIAAPDSATMPEFTGIRENDKTDSDG